MSVKKNFFFGATTVVVFFLILEGIARLVTVPGSFDFIERCAIEQELRIKKQPGEYRIFLYGESTMHGNQLYPKSTIKIWLELYLEELLGKEAAKKVTIINFGRLGESSDFISQSFFDTLVYKPDAVVFYTAHNDFIQLENRQHLLHPKLAKKLLEGFQELSKHSCLVSTFKRMAVKGKIERRRKRDAKESFKDRWYNEEKRKTYNAATDLLAPGGEDFNRVKSHWEQNVMKIIQRAQKNGIRVIFLEGVAKYREYAPFESVHTNLSNIQIQEWKKLDALGREYFERGDFGGAIVWFEKAVALDPHYAMSYFHLGECYEKLENYPQAKKFYLIANDLDYFPIRAPSAVNQFYEKIKASNPTGTDIIRTQELFWENSPHGLVEDELIFDQLHPTIEGQALIAKEILKTLSDHEVIAPMKEWHWENIRPTQELRQQVKFDHRREFRMYLNSAKYAGSYLDQAIYFLNKALALEPRSIAAKSQLAWIYWKKGDEDMAVRLYRELYAQNPKLTGKFLDKYPKLKGKVQIR